MTDRLAVDTAQAQADLIDSLQAWAGWLGDARRTLTADLLREAAEEIGRLRRQRDLAVAERNQVVSERDRLLAAFGEVNDRYTREVNQMHRRAQKAEGLIARAGLIPARPHGVRAGGPRPALVTVDATPAAPNGGPA